MKLGNRLRELRLQKQMTQKDVVGEYMTRNMLSKIENNNATPSIKTLEYLARVFKEPVGYFLDDEDDNAVSSTCTSELTKISDLADRLYSSAVDSMTRCFALCIKAHACMALGSTEEALAALETSMTADWPEEQMNLIYRTAEEFCAQAGDYERAYRYATKRFNT